MTPPAGAEEHLSAIVGAAHVLDQAALANRDPGVDPNNLRADLLVRPSSTQEVAAVLAYCHAARIGVVPQGGRTGLAGGASTRSGEIILSLERFARVESLDPVGRTAVVGAGVTLATLARAAAEAGLSPAIDMGSRDSATIGGMISTNAGGSEAFRHGTMRERVLGLEIVLADGSVLRELGLVRKRNEGLPVPQLFIGAEGTLGVITRASLALVPAKGPVATALVSVATLADAVDVCTALLRSKACHATALEFMSANHAVATARAAGNPAMIAFANGPAACLLLIEATAAADTDAQAAIGAFVEGLPEDTVVDGIVAQGESQRLLMWRIREDWAVDRERPGGLWYDVSVPIVHLDRYISALEQRLRELDPGLALYYIGHLGDGNLHLTINADHPIPERYEEVAAVVTQGLAEMGGSFSAEHGIGTEKLALLARLAGNAKLNAMRQVKSVLDPHGIMNPGKVIPP